MHKLSVNSPCFFCHKNFNSDSSENIFYLRQLFCHLKIKFKFDQKSVLLCFECNKLGCQLNQKFVNLDATQMSINYLLEQLFSKIGTDSSRYADELQTLVKEKCKPTEFLLSRINNLTLINH